MLRPYTVPYDARGLRGLFKSGGMADFCPVMARLNLTQMEQNRGYLVDFVTRALKIAQERGEEIVSRETWLLADSRYPWPDGLSTAAFWREANG